MSLVSPLTYKQARFVEAYLGEANGNATKAARIAGYAVPDPEGSRQLGKARIAAAIRARLAERCPSADEVLARLGDHARGTLAEFVRLEEDGRWSLDLEAAKAAGKLHLVHELSYTAKGRPTIKLYDAQAALIQLGKYYRLWDRQDESAGAITVLNQVNVSVAPEQLDAEILAILARARRQEREARVIEGEVLDGRGHDRPALQPEPEDG